MTDAEKRIVDDVMKALKIAQDNLVKTKVDPTDALNRIFKANVRGEIAHALRQLELLEEE